MKYMILCTFILFFSISATMADDPGINHSSYYYSDENNVAIEGFDPVSYFDGEALVGTAEFSYEYDSVNWYFSSQQNLDRFIATPQQFVPQYGGYCAWALARNYTSDVDPQQWDIVDGKLYLNASFFIKTRWRLNRDSLIEKADGFWPEIDRLLRE